MQIYICIYKCIMHICPTVTHGTKALPRPLIPHRPNSLNSMFSHNAYLSYAQHFLVSPKGHGSHLRIVNSDRTIVRIQSSIWRLPQIGGPATDPKMVGLLLQGHPTIGPPMYRNSHFHPKLVPLCLVLTVTHSVSSLALRVSHTTDWRCRAAFRLGGALTAFLLAGLLGNLRRGAAGRAAESEMRRLEVRRLFVSWRSGGSVRAAPT